MADQSYDPSEHDVDEVLDELKDADPTQAQAIVQAERDGKGRKTILAAGGDTDRAASNGRTMYPWEIDPKNQVKLGNQV